MTTWIVILFVAAIVLAVIAAICKFIIDGNTVMYIAETSKFLRLAFISVACRICAYVSAAVATLLTVLTIIDKL